MSSLGEYKVKEGSGGCERQVKVFKREWWKSQYKCLLFKQIHIGLLCFVVSPHFFFSNYICETIPCQIIYVTGIIHNTFSTLPSISKVQRISLKRRKSNCTSQSSKIPIVIQKRYFIYYCYIWWVCVCVYVCVCVCVCVCAHAHPPVYMDLWHAFSVVIMYMCLGLISTWYWITYQRTHCCTKPSFLSKAVDCLQLFMPSWASRFFFFCHVRWLIDLWYFSR